MEIKKIVSGGQAGVDRAALDAAIDSGIPVGGWCPKGRRAEDGRIDLSYPLKETPSESYIQRTEWNVRDSDATLIIYRSKMSGGTLATWELARKYERPCIPFDLKAEMPTEVQFPDTVTVLNVAGPRESQNPGIYKAAYELLVGFFSRLPEA